LASIEDISIPEASDIIADGVDIDVLLNKGFKRKNELRF